MICISFSLVIESNSEKLELDALMVNNTLLQYYDHLGLKQILHSTVNNNNAIANWVSHNLYHLLEWLLRKKR